MLIKVGDVMESIKNFHVGGYQVADLDEEKQLMKALEEDNPILSEAEIKRLLKN